jgi:phage-related baseplate assembly protein
MNLTDIQLPNVIREYSYDMLLSENISNMQNLIPDWKPSEGDVPMIILEALSYRELHLRAYLNQLSRAFFLLTTTDRDLDNYAVLYGLTRLEGAYPVATYSFSLTSALNYDVIIPQDSILVDAGGKYKARLMEKIIFSRGETTKEGLLELQEYITETDTVTNLMQNPLPYVGNIQPLTKFENGREREDDETFKKRILLSFADKSTAGSEETYKSFTYKADTRIEDCSVYSPVGEYESLARDGLGAGTVIVTVYVPDSQEQYILDEVYDNLSQDDVRPLTDNVVVQHAKIIEYTINATLYIYPNTNSIEIYNSALKSLEEGLKGLEKIDADITLSELNSFLRVQGVKEVIINSPSERIAVDIEHIAKCVSKEINYKVYYEEL